MKPLRRAALAIVLLLVCPLALAWSKLGHQLIGELAQRHLTVKARAQVDLLLAGEPDPTLAGVSTWADTLRNDDPTLFKATASWHYVKINAADCTYVAERDCPDGRCVVGAIDAQRKILADRSQPRATRRDALKFIVHFIGDIHQPLHTSNRDDKGGNGYQISLRTPLAPEVYARKNYRDGVMGTNLHAIWDFYVLGSAGFGPDKPAVVPYADRLDREMPASAAAAGLTPTRAWAEESCRLVDARKLYPANGSHKLQQSYLDAQRPLAEQRVTEAAERLAAVLNATLID